MSLFRVFVDGDLFYHPGLSKLAITQAQVKEDAENIDSLTLSAPFNHPYLEKVKPMASTIVCKKDDQVVFEGRALDDGSDFYNTHTWTCESALAYLKDSLQPPYDYQGTIKGLLELFVENHNAKVEEKKRFTVGNVTVMDSNDYIHYSNSEHSVTLEAIKEKLIKTYGGFLCIRYTDNGKVLDYLSDFKTYSVQTVEFGKNLLDVKITKDHTERVTALIPYGAKIKTTDEEGNEVETDERVSIASINDGVPYVYDEDAVSGTHTLTTIPRASSVSATAVNLGSATTVSISRASSSFTHTLTYSFGSATGTIATKTSSTSVSWTPPLSLANQIPSATSGTCTITCTTYNGSTSIGSYGL